MPFDDPDCFRLDRIPVRPIHWLWWPYPGLRQAGPFSTATPKPASRSSPPTWPPA